MATPDILIRRFPAGWQASYLTDKAQAFQDTIANPMPLMDMMTAACEAGLVIMVEKGGK